MFLINVTQLILLRVLSILGACINQHGCNNGMQRINKKKIIIFGGSSGIGSATSKLLSSEYDVLIASRTPPPESLSDCQWVRCDVTDSEDVSTFMSGLEPTVFAVINCAGSGVYSPFNMDFASYWKMIVDTNLLGALHVSCATSEFHSECEHLITVGSIAAKRPSPTPGNDVYAAAKQAVARTMDDLRIRLRAQSSTLRVTTITPGFVEGTKFGKDFFRSAPDQTTQLYGAFRSLQPEDVAQSIYWCLSQPTHVEISDIIIRPREQSI